VSIRGSEVQNHVQRLIGQLEATAGSLELFRETPATAVPRYFDLNVEFRSPGTATCAIAGSFHPEDRLITVERSRSDGRVRFTILHELGHALAYGDYEIQDWLFGLDSLSRRVEEQLANAFATEVLLPKSAVDQVIPAEGPTAWDVVRLWRSSTASREAVCVRSAQRLLSSGLVAIVRGSTIQFAAGHSLLFDVPRDSDQGVGSFFDQSTHTESLRDVGVELSLPDGLISGSFYADAYRDDDGYAFVVLQESGPPWLAGLSVSTEPELHELECPECDRVRRTGARRCPKCGDFPCPDHGCSCMIGPWRDPRARHCERCHIELPLATSAGTRFCDRHE
jgi:IrrE N-terminal-like domain